MVVTAATNAFSSLVRMKYIFLMTRYDFVFFFFSSRRRHTRCSRDWSSDVCSSDLFKSRVVRMALAGSPGQRLKVGVHFDWLYVSSRDRKSTRLNSSHGYISYAVFCLKKKK